MLAFLMQMVASEVPSSCQAFSFVHLNIKDGFINGINRDKGWVKGASNWAIGKVNHPKNLWLEQTGLEAKDFEVLFVCEVVPGSVVPHER